MIRLIIFLLYAIIIVVATPFIFLFMLLFWKNNTAKKDAFSQKFVRGVFKCVLFITGVKTTAIGLENVPDDTAVLYVGNHNSYFDILVSYIYFKKPTGYVAKKEMLRYPLLREWMQYVHCLFLDRDNPKEGLKTILKGIENVKNGYSVFIFPEGTRSLNGEILPFKEGALKIAEKSKCPVIPVTINNTAAAFEQHIPFLKKCHVVIEFGSPVIISELAAEDRKFLGAYTQKIIADTYEKNKTLV